MSNRRDELAGLSGSGIQARFAHDGLFPPGVPVTLHSIGEGARLLQIEATLSASGWAINSTDSSTSSLITRGTASRMVSSLEKR